MDKNEKSAVIMSRFGPPQLKPIVVPELYRLHWLLGLLLCVSSPTLQGNTVGSSSLWCNARYGGAMPWRHL